MTLFSIVESWRVRLVVVRTVAHAAVVFAVVSCTAVPPKQPQGETARAALPTLSAQDKSDIAYIAKLPRHGTAVEFDLSDPIQYRHFMRQWELGGATAKLYPELFKSFEETRQKHQARRVAANAAKPLNLERDITPMSTPAQPIVPLNYLSGFGPAAPGTYAVTAVTSVPGTMQVPGTVTATTVGLYDSNNNPLGPATTVEQYGNGAQMRNPTSAPAPVSGDVIAQGSYFYKTVVNGVIVPHAGGMSVRSAQSTSGQYTMTHLSPIDVNGNGTIKICIVRNDGDCDYRSLQVGGQFIVQFPIQDTLSIPDTLQSIANQQAGGWVQITVSQPDAGSGGGCTLPANFNFWNGATIIGKKITWNFNPGPFSNPGGASVPCFPSNTNVVYDLQVYVLGTNGGVTSGYFGEVKTTTNPPPPPPPGSAYLVPMVVAYGCVAEGSLVTMADGSTKAIEHVQLGDLVRPAAGVAPLRVLHRTDGVEREPMVRLVTARGQRLLLTATHPVMTTRGVLMARDVRAGMTVATVDGPVAVTRALHERFAGKVWNLEVVGTNAAFVPTETNTTFIANGLVVGDSRMQQQIERTERERIAAASRYIAPEWRVDARNYEAQQRLKSGKAGQ